jgi:predicted HTH domain antitoxin
VITLKAVIIEFPEEVVELYEEKELENSVRKWSVLELVRNGKLSSGKASEILGMTRWDFMELMSDYDIPMVNFSPEELESQAKKRLL